MPIDLTDLLSGPKKKLPKNVISFDDLIPEPRKCRNAVEVVLFWTDWTCACGRKYEMPTYGDTLTKYEQLRYGKFQAYIYEKYLPANHAHLPRIVESTHIAIQHCPSCYSEDSLTEDFQLELFNA